MLHIFKTIYGMYILYIYIIILQFMNILTRCYNIQFTDYAYIRAQHSQRNAGAI